MNKVVSQSKSAKRKTLSPWPENGKGSCCTTAALGTFLVHRREHPGRIVPPVRGTVLWDVDCREIADCTFRVYEAGL